MLCRISQRASPCFPSCFFGLAFIFLLSAALPAAAQVPAPKDKEYLALVDAAIATPDKADWKAIRSLYIETSFYDSARRHGMGGTPMNDFGRKAVELKTPEAIALYRENARKYAGAIDTHLEAYNLAEKDKASFVDPAYTKSAFKGLTEALLATGDGRSMKTAFKVVSTSEQYFLMRSIFRLTIRGKTLEQGDGQMFDIHKVSNSKGEDVGDIFFNISLYFGKMEMPPELTKKIQEAMRANPPPAKPQAAVVPETDTKYLALVDAAMKNQGQANWSEIRRLYPETTFYKRVGGINLAHYGRDMTDYVAKRMTPEAIANYKQFQREHYASIGAHSRARTLHELKKPAFIDPAAEQYAFDGLLRSLRASGDGKTKPTAFKALSMDEASYLLASVFRTPPDLKVEKEKDVQYLAFTGKDKEAGAPLTLYFLLDPRAVTAAFSPPPPAMSRMTINVAPGAQEQPRKEAPLRDPRHPDATKVSYILVDLNGDGITFGALKDKQSIYWDIDDDEFAEATGWPQDAFLGIDLNGDGRIRGNAEMFGVASVNALDLLAEKDDNKDGRIDAKDKVWQSLRLWRDDNRNGGSEVIEVSTMEEAKVDAIGLKITRDRKEQDGNTILSRASIYMTGADGKAAVRDMAAVFLVYDDMNTVDVRNHTIVVDAQSLMLPQLRGYGVLQDLTSAMSRDKTLLGLVRDLSMMPLATLVTDPAGYEARMNTAIFRWVGADALDPASRGPNIDARRLRAIEKLTGEKFAQIGAGGLDNPLAFAANSLNQSYTSLFNHFYGILGAQIYASQVFMGKIYYDQRMDTLANVAGLNIPSIAELSALIAKQEQPLRRREAWKALARIIKTAEDAKIPPEDGQALDALIKQSDPSLDYAKLLEFLKTEDIRNLPGHDYVAKVLKLSAKDGDLNEVLALARQKDSSKQIVYSGLVTEILRSCCKTEQQIVDYLTAQNFRIGIYPLEAARRESGTNFTYTKVLKAVRQPTLMETMGTKFGADAPPDLNIVFVYMNGDAFEWAYGHIQK